MAVDGLRDALDSYAQAQDQLVEARNRLARAIAGAAMSGMTRDEIVDLTQHLATGWREWPRRRLASNHSPRNASQPTCSPDLISRGSRVCRAG